MDFRILFLLCIGLVTLPGTAQSDASLGQPSHDQAMVQMAGVMYMREMSIKCPFPKDAADGFEIIAMIFVPTLPKFNPDEIKETSKKIEARVSKEFLLSKEEACRNAQKNLEDFIASVARKNAP